MHNNKKVERDSRYLDRLKKLRELGYMPILIINTFSSYEKILKRCKKYRMSPIICDYTKRCIFFISFEQALEFSCTLRDMLLVHKSCVHQIYTLKQLISRNKL